MNKNSLIFIITILFLIIIQSSVYSIESNLKVPGKEMPCIGRNCTILLDTVKEFAKYEIYNTFEISGNLIHKTIRIEYFKTPPSPYCMRMIYPKGENPRVFDIHVSKNGEQVDFKPYLDFYVEENKNVANFTCYSVQANDIIEINYYVGNKIKPVDIKIIFLNISLSEFFYPLDKYILTAWSSIDNVYYNRVDKVILPNSLIYIENETENSCPCVFKGTFFLEKINETGVEPIKTPLFDFYIFGDWYVFEGGGEGSFITQDNKRILIWPILTAGTLDEIKSINPSRYNFSQDEWNNIFDWRTGCYLKVTYERTPIIKYFFVFSTILMFVSTVYLLWFAEKENRLHNTIRNVFLIWSFQEGLSSLVPLTRPTTITIFDLNILLIIIPLVIFYRRNIFNEIKEIFYDNPRIFFSLLIFKLKKKLNKRKNFNHM